MKEDLRQLVRLQELEFVRSEQCAMEDEASASALGAVIQGLLAQLPESSATLFRRLRERDLAAAVPVHHGACSACGFALPTSQVGAVRRGKELERCRNCRRILYHVEHLPQQHRAIRSSKSAPLGSARFSSPTLMLPELVSESREGALAEIIERMACESVVEDPARVLTLALERERLASTALGDGLAFPHVREIEGGGMVFGLGLKRDGLLFDPNLGRRTRIIVFTVSPAAASTVYLRLVGDLLQTLRHQSARTKLLSCTTGTALWRTLASLTSGPRGPF